MKERGWIKEERLTAILSGLCLPKFPCAIRLL